MDVNEVIEAVRLYLVDHAEAPDDQAVDRTAMESFTFAHLRALVDAVSGLESAHADICERYTVALRENAKMAEALRPFAHFWRQWERQPMRGLDDEFYVIHTGTDYEASLRRSDCEAASDLLRGVSDAS